MKLVLLTLALLLIPTSENTSGHIELYTYWKKGDTQKIVVKEGYEEYKNGEIVEKEVTISNVLITVLEETDTSYTVEWNYYDTKVDRLNVEVEEDEIDKRIDEMFDHLKLVYTTNEFGEYQELLNLDDLMKSMSDSIDVLVAEEMADLGDDAPLFADVMKEMVNSESMRDEMDKDIYAYHYCLGGRYAADTIVHYVDELENKMSGDNIPLVGTLTLKVNTDNKTFSLNDFKSIDEESAKDAINDVVKDLKVKKRKKLKRELKKNKFEIEDIENYTYDYEYGWLKYYERNRIYRTDEGRKERFIIIEEVE
ncbi:MAG: hypothetical protein AB8F74_02970 [Saprospiraceae bacterium]